MFSSRIKAVGKRVTVCKNGGSIRGRKNFVNHACREDDTSKAIPSNNDTDEMMTRINTITVRTRPSAGNYPTEPYYYCHHYYYYYYYYYYCYYYYYY